MRTLKVKAIIFDMDGVITNTMPDHYFAWKKVLQEAGVRVNFLDIYAREGQRGILSVKELFKKYKKKLTPDLAEKLLLKKEVLFKKIVKKRFITGARRFIKNEYARGFDLGLVTGTSRHEMLHMLPKEIYKLFKVTVTGNDVVKGKPHAEPYLKCIKHLGIKRSEACVIENAPFGIQSAKSAGLICVALQTSLPKRYLAKADVIVPGYKQLIKKIKFMPHEI